MMTTNNPIDPRLANMQEAFKCIDTALLDIGVGELTPKRPSRVDLTVDGDLDDVLGEICCRLEWDITRTHDGVQTIRITKLLTHTIDADVTAATELPGPAGTDWSVGHGDPVAPFATNVMIYLTDLRWVDAGDGKYRRAIATFSVEADGE